MSVSKIKVAVLISGRGSNLKSLILKQQNYEVCAVISNRAKAPGLQYARNAEIPHYIFAKADYASAHEQQLAMLKRLQSINPDFICLAGFLQILDAALVKHFAGRIINIHPSLLPNLKGLFGLNVHQAALDQKLSEHGCSVHLVEEEVDAGAILAQAALKVSPNITAEDLAAEVLQMELKLYPWVMNKLAAGEIKIINNRLEFSENIYLEAQKKNYILGERHDTI